MLLIIAILLAVRLASIYRFTHHDYPNLHRSDRAGDEEGNREESLELMRREMIGSRNYGAAVFIGGMEGIFDEARIFKEIHPERKIIPVASTGGAKKDLIERGEGARDEKLFEILKNENRYRRLFLEFLPTD